MSVNLGTPLAQAWKRRIGRWRRSGLSATAFGRQEKVSAPRLYTWRKRFAAMDVAPRPIPSTLSHPTFIPVQLKAAPAVIELDLKDGHVLRLPGDFDVTRLAALLRSLGPC